MNEQESGVAEQIQGATDVQVEPTVDQNRQVSARLAELHTLIGRGAGWFYWVAGLSIINTLIALFNGSFVLLFGLGVTQIVDSLIHELGTGAAIIGIPINLFIAAVYVMFGYCATRRMKWAFYVGMFFYVLDGLLLLLVQEWLSVAFHAWVLFSIIRGIRADAEARQLEAQLPM